MSELSARRNTKPIKRLNSTLPDSLAVFVSIQTGPGGLYETPSEYIRDLIRHDMEAWEAQEHRSFFQTALLSMESPTTKLEDDFFDKKRKKLAEMQTAKAQDSR
jgi:antitoxin ParD1/3/4